MQSFLKLLLGATLTYHILAVVIVFAVIVAFFYESVRYQRPNYDYNPNDHAGFISDQIKECVSFNRSFGPPLNETECGCFMSKAESHIELNSAHDLAAAVKKQFYAKNFDLPLSSEVLVDAFYKSNHRATYHGILFRDEGDPKKIEFYNLHKENISHEAVKSRGQTSLAKRVQIAGLNTCVTGARFREIKHSSVGYRLGPILSEVHRNSRLRNNPNNSFE